MLISVDPSTLKSTKPHEYAIRFLFGGVLTAITGLLAKKFGPTVGGLFLAFPAIFPASVTLIEEHEKQRKRESGYDGTSRGRAAASVEAAGTSIGALSLILFAVIVFRCLPSHSEWATLVIAGFFWSALSILGWYIRKKVRM